MSDVPNLSMEYPKSELPAIQFPVSLQSISKDQGQDAEFSETIGSKIRGREGEEWHEKSQEEKNSESSLRSGELKILARKASSDCSEMKAKVSHAKFRERDTCDFVTKRFFSFDWFLEPLAKHCLGIFYYTN